MVHPQSFLSKAFTFCQLLAQSFAFFLDKRTIACVGKASLPWLRFSVPDHFFHDVLPALAYAGRIFRRSDAPCAVLSASVTQRGPGRATL